MYKSIQRLRLTKSDRILVLHAPKSFAEFEQYFTAGIDREIKGRAYPSVFYFTAEITNRTEEISHLLRSIAHDALFWFCFPKQGDSENLKLSKEDIREFFALFEMEPVAQRTIDEHWTALRIRPSDLVTHRRK